MSSPTRDFQVTLISDSSKRYFPNNKPTHFQVHMPTPMLMRDFGPWQVALVDIELPHTWNNFDREVLIAFGVQIGQKGEPVVAHRWEDRIDELEMETVIKEGGERQWPAGTFMRYVKEQGTAGLLTEYRDAVIRPCHFEHVRELGAYVVRLFNHLFRDRMQNASLAYKFDERTGKGRFYAYGIEVRCICDSGYLFTSLGMEWSEIHTNDRRYPQGLPMVELTDAPQHRARVSDIDTVYVYSDLCSLTNVGGTESPFLATVPIARRSYGSVTHWSASPAYYMSLAKEEVQSIELDLRTGSGDPIPFREGQVVCRLHFDNSSSSY